MFVEAASSAPFLAPLPPRGASAEEIVRGFLKDVRSGRHPELAQMYLAPRVRAHQVASEGESLIERTPLDYALHVGDFLAFYGPFRFEIVELISGPEKVYVRWRQEGRHLASFDGEPPTGAPLVEISSAVYRVQGGRIVEYWIQTDRAGLDAQLSRAAAAPSSEAR